VQDLAAVPGRGACRRCLRQLGRRETVELVRSRAVVLQHQASAIGRPRRAPRLSLTRIQPCAPAGLSIEQPDSPARISDAEPGACQYGPHGAPARAVEAALRLGQDITVRRAVDTRQDDPPIVAEAGDRAIGKRPPVGRNACLHRGAVAPLSAEHDLRFAAIDRYRMQAHRIALVLDAAVGRKPNGLSVGQKRRTVVAVPPLGETPRRTSRGRNQEEVIAVLLSFQGRLRETGVAVDDPFAVGRPGREGGVARPGGQRRAGLGRQIEDMQVERAVAIRLKHDPLTVGRPGGFGVIARARRELDQFGAQGGHRYVRQPKQADDPAQDAWAPRPALATSTSPPARMHCSHSRTRPCFSQCLFLPKEPSRIKGSLMCG